MVEIDEGDSSRRVGENLLEEEEEVEGEGEGEIEGKEDDWHL